MNAGSVRLDGGNFDNAAAGNYENRATGTTQINGTFTNEGRVVNGGTIDVARVGLMFQNAGGTFTNAGATVIDGGRSPTKGVCWTPEHFKSLRLAKYQALAVMTKLPRELTRLSTGHLVTISFFRRVP